MGKIHVVNDEFTAEGAEDRSELLCAAFRRDLHSLASGGIGNQAQKLHGRVAGVAELMHFVRLYEYDIAFGKFVLLVAFKHHAVAVEHEHFMLIIVANVGVPSGWPSNQRTVQPWAPSISTGLAGTAS
jgi:hypothetical protein